jgi:glycosyltransferase involved in cell wall biosynthesis
MPFLGQLTSLVRHLRTHEYDIIHSHLFPAQLWLALATFVVSGMAPVVTTEHNTWNRRRKPVLRLRDRWLYLSRIVDILMYRRYRAVVCVSDAVRAAIVPWIGPKVSEFVVVMNGIDLGRFSGISSREFRVDQDLMILTVGTLCERKDYPTLLRALRRLPQGRLVIVGDGEMRDSLVTCVWSWALPGGFSFWAGVTTCLN